MFIGLQGAYLSLVECMDIENSNFLHKQATGWQLEEAIQLFYVGNEAGSIAAAQPPTENIENLADQTSGYFILFSSAFLCRHFFFLF